MPKDGNLRMLGACDGYAHALIRVRQEIAPIDGQYSPGIHPRHVRKLADKQRRLRPLRELEKWLTEQHAETQKAYRSTCK